MAFEARPGMGCIIKCSVVTPAVPAWSKYLGFVPALYIQGSSKSQYTELFALLLYSDRSSSDVIHVFMTGHGSAVAWDDYIEAGSVRLIDA